MGRKPGNFTEVILMLNNLLHGQQLAFRGTTSLVLQGFDFNADDIDILATKQSALAYNTILKQYLIHEVALGEHEQFKSYFGTFNVEGVTVEVMGDWQIKNRKGAWSEPFTASSAEITTLLYESQHVPVTTVETELKMYALMNRWPVFHKLKTQITKSKSQSDKPKQRALI